MNDEKIINSTAEELKQRTQAFFVMKQTAEFSPIINTMIDNLR